MVTTLATQINQNLIDAYKEKDSVKKSALSMLKVMINNEQKNNNGAISDERVISIVQKQMKEINETADAYAKAGNSEKQNIELKKIKVLENYLPEQMSDEELSALIDSIIVKHDANSMRDMGKVMGTLKKEAAGQADTSKMASMVKSKLMGS